jgi:hypothetical protein
MEMSQETQEFFNKNKFVVIKQFLPADMALLSYEYCKIRVKRTDWILQNAKEDYRLDQDGAFGDGQIPNSFNCYSDPYMETLLLLTTDRLKEFTGLDLVPQYSYWRFYQTGDVLERHTDRGSCEISTTLCLGSNTENVDKSVYPNYQWPMFVKDPQGNELPVALEAGDLIVYRGCEIEHWREKFIGLNHAQAFLHYNIAGGQFDYKFDGRPGVGFPLSSKDNSKISR